MSETVQAAPERHLSIDAVRGFAVLGILLMNIVGMGLPSFSYINPTYWGNDGPADLWTWAINSVFTDGKMRALFTMLFGASTVLIATRAEGGDMGPARTHYSRMFWLLVIGFVHAYLLWWGDILVCYAIAGLVIFPFRKLGPRLLIAIGAVILALLIAKNLVFAGELKTLYEAVKGPNPPADLLKTWSGFALLVDPPKSLALQEIAGFGGSFMQALNARVYVAQILQLQYLPLDSIPEAIGQMLIGMGLFRLGFFTLGWSNRAYGLMIAAGYLIGAPFTAWTVWQIWQAGFEPMALHEISIWQALPRPVIALAHASVLLLVIRAGLAGGLVERLAAAGRMAFSNYLMTSIITTLVFCGFGLGLYGQLSRFELLYVVAGVWVFILVWSKPWLARFHYGPFEWVWRSLVKLKPQPFVRGGAKPAVA